jgi:broad specificity phosphatase PhoE
VSATTFHLVRHASHDLLGRALVGRGPVSLSPAGREEAAAIAATLGGLGLAAVACSPRERALETARPLAARAGLEVTVEPGLDELDLGAWTGARFGTLDDDPRWRAFNVFRGTAPVPDGESMLAVQARAVACVLRLRAAYPDASVALVSHADVIKAVLVHFLGMTLDLMRRIELAPGSRSVLTLYDEDAVVQAINLPPGQ